MVALVDRRAVMQRRRRQCPRFRPRWGPPSRSDGRDRRSGGVGGERPPAGPPRAGRARRPAPRTVATTSCMYRPRPPPASRGGGRRTGEPASPRWWQPRRGASQPAAAAPPTPPSRAVTASGGRGRLRAAVRPHGPVQRTRQPRHVRGGPDALPPPPPSTTRTPSRAVRGPPGGGGAPPSVPRGGWRLAELGSVAQVHPPPPARAPFRRGTPNARRPSASPPADAAAAGCQTLCTAGLSPLSPPSHCAPSAGGRHVAGRQRRSRYTGRPGGRDGVRRPRRRVPVAVAPPAPAAAPRRRSHPTGRHYPCPALSHARPSPRPHIPALLTLCHASPEQPRAAAAHPAPSATTRPSRHRRSSPSDEPERRWGTRHCPSTSCHR